MIDLASLTKSDVGRGVVYRPGHPWVPPEDGNISSWNDKYVFVRYRGDLHTKATDPRDLDWAKP